MVEAAGDMDKIRQLLQSEQEEERLAALRLIDRHAVRAALPLLYAAFGDASWRVRKEATELFFSLPPAEAEIAAVIRCLYSEDNAGLRNTAVEILTRLGRLAVPRLIEEVRSPDHDVRKFSLDILGGIDDERSVPAMRAALADDDGNVRAAAAENLGRLAAIDAVPDLLTAMDTPDLLLRFTILEALGQMNAPVPAERLLQFRDDRLLRKALVDCLGRVGDAKAVPYLVQCLGDSMRNVREAAALALSRLTTHANTVIESVQKMRTDDHLSMTLGGLLESASADVRRAAINLFGHLGDHGSIARLLDLTDDDEMRDEAIAALIAIGRENPGVLCDSWSKVDGRQRAYVAYVFGELASPLALPLLLQGASDSSLELRHTCVQSLGRLGDAVALAPLTTALEDDSLDVREAALLSLTQIGARFRTETTATLSPLLEHHDPQVRMYAVTVLGRIDGDDVARHLALAIKDESADVRSAAIRSIEGKGGGELLPLLMLALTDEESEVRALAARSLGQSDDLQAVKPLELALQDEDMWVRAAAVRSLGALAGLDAEASIASALQDPVGLVVIAALETLERLIPDRVVDYACQCLAHRDDEVVLAALSQLQFTQGAACLSASRAQLLHHPHTEVRLHFARMLADTEGGECLPELERLVEDEEDEYLRQELQVLVMHLKQVEED